MCVHRPALVERYLALGLGGTVLRRCSTDKLIGLLMASLCPNPFASPKLTARPSSASPIAFLQSHNPSAAPSQSVEYETQTLEEAALWCKKALAIALPLASDTSFAKTQHTWNVATVFSGIGAPEHACAFLQSAFKGTDNEIVFSFVSACESAPKRQAGTHCLTSITRHDQCNR